MNVELHNGIFGVSVIVGAAELSIAMVFDALFGHLKLLSREAVLIGVTFTFIANMVVFMRNKAGKKFEHEFLSLDEREQSKMKFLAIAIVVLDICLLVASGIYYRHELRI